MHLLTATGQQSYWPLKFKAKKDLVLRHRLGPKSCQGCSRFSGSQACLHRALAKLCISQCSCSHFISRSKALHSWHGRAAQSPQLERGFGFQTPTAMLCPFEFRVYGMCWGLDSDVSSFPPPEVVLLPFLDEECRL